MAGTITVKSTAASNKGGTNTYKTDSKGNPTGVRISYTNAPTNTGSGGGNTGNSTTKKVSYDPGYDSSAYRNSISALSRELAAQRTALAARQAKAEANINSDYNIAKLGLEKTQEKDYAGRATSLVTSGGGFLGATQSQEGVLQNLKGTFEAEKNALLSKKEEALLASQTAYEDKDFALSTKMLELAKDAEKEIYNRTQDYTNNVLKISQENRAQTGFEYDVTDKKIQGYANMSDQEFAKVDQNEIANLDKNYFPGYTAYKRNTEKTSNEIERMSKIINIKNDVPAGQKFTINGVTYVGTKAPTGGYRISDPIPQFIANQIGIPQLAGQSQSDIIWSLDLENPPLWYMQFYKNSNPTGWEVAKDRPDIIKNEWETFRKLSELQPFINTVKLNKRGTQSDNPFTPKP